MGGTQMPHGGGGLFTQSLRGCTESRKLTADDADSARFDNPRHPPSPWLFFTALFAFRHTLSSVSMQLKVILGAGNAGASGAAEP